LTTITPNRYRAAVWCTAAAITLGSFTCYLIPFHKGLTVAKDKDEVIHYRIHEMAAAFPLPSADEYAAIKDNGKKFRFIYPKVFWRDEKDNVWLIDGRTRDRIETEFTKAGEEEAENGHPLKCPAVFFKGTASEAVNYVRGLNLSRRAMNSGQKAAAAILSGALYRQYKAKEDGLDLDEDSEEEIGDMATRVAKEAGTNRAYVFDCAKLHRENPDLLQRVLAGGDDGLSIPNAKKIAKRRADGLPDEEPEAGDEPVEVAPENGPEAVLDGLGNEVPEDLRNVFLFRAAVKAAKKQIRAAVNGIEAESEKPGAKNLSIQTVKADANNVVRHLEDHQPHAQCPYCSGTGKDADNPQKKCGQCKGRKFLDRIQWKQVPAELRALYEKKPSDDKDDDKDDDNGEKYGT